MIGIIFALEVAWILLLVYLPLALVGRGVMASERENEKPVVTINPTEAISLMNDLSPSREVGGPRRPEP